MATIEYSLSSKKDKTTEKQEILVRFFHGRFNQRGKTNIYGHSDDWDQDRQRFVIPKVRMMTEEKRKEIQELQNLNSELDAISRYLLDVFVAAGSGKVPLPNKWVADKLLERTVESLDIPTVEDAKEVSFATLSSDLLRKFSKFLENEHKFVVEGKDGKPCIKDPLYKKAYKSVPECRFPKQRGQNSIIGTMSRLHTFVRWAIKRGYMNRDPYDDYVIGTAIYGTPFYLTKEERNQLYQAKFPDNPGLDVQRDIKKMIKLAGIDRVVTTLNTITREEEKHPIWEVASSHMARRVLVGNLYKEVKDPNLIAKISGHVENSRAFSRYRDIDEEMAKEVILKLE